MYRPVISPLNTNTTVPETFTVLQQRINTAEEQAEALIKDLGTLGVSGGELQMFSKPPGGPELHRPISPVHTRKAFTGENDTLWKNCESLVSRVCRMESIIQTLKLNIFRLQTEKELNPNSSAQLAERLKSVQEEHIQELRTVQREMMRLRQQLCEVNEEKEAAQDELHRLSAALEIATATKTDVVMAAEELKTVKSKMSRKLHELQEQLGQEVSLRLSLEESQAALLQRVQDMEKVVEQEREQVQLLQKECKALTRDSHETQERLQREQQRADKLEKAHKELKIESDAKESIIAQLSDEGKNTQLALNKEREKMRQLRSEVTSLREMAEKIQTLNDQLNRQCAEMSSTLRAVTMENAKLLTDHQAALKLEQEKMSQKLQEQDLLLDAARANIACELQSAQNEKVQLQKELVGEFSPRLAPLSVYLSVLLWSSCSEFLHSRHQEVEQRARAAEEKASAGKELHDSVITRLREDLETAIREREVLKKEKESLRIETRKTVSSMTEEKNRTETQLTENQLEVSALTSTLNKLEEENRGLLERLVTLEHQQHAQQQVEQVLADLMDSKNKLAYDKGKLQTKVQQLQEELESLADAQSNNHQLRKLNTALEAKYNQVNMEYSSCKINLQRLEAQLKQAQSVLERKEEDFALAIKSRDDALRESQKIKGHAEALEEREKQKIAKLQCQLADSKQDNSKMATTLENVLASHSKLQKALEKLQTELGCRDTEIAGLRRDRSQGQQKIQRLEAEVEELQAKLTTRETEYCNQVEPFQKVLEEVRRDNKKLALSLEQALQTNISLQGQLSHAQDELANQETYQQQLLDSREQVAEEARMEAQLFTERLESLKKQFKNEKETVRKAAQKEILELKKGLDETSSRSAELSRANRELRQKVVELENAAANQKAKIKSQKAQMKHYLKTKASKAQNAERLKEIEEELKQMETIKEQYQKKNYEQSQMIQKFMVEMTSLQTEIQKLAKSQHETTVQSRQQEIHLRAERKLRQELQDKCQSLEEKVKHLKKCKEATEQKLKEASLESQQITMNLEEAHKWFKSKFDSLQSELTKARLNNRMGEGLTSWENSEEDEPYSGDSPRRRSRVKQVKERPVKLPSQSSVNRWETKQELKLLSRMYQPESDKK
nr:PREDICTED: coiled-coil domain-containing protein 150 [Latimeria chalumnae]|eukprot:XP_014344292.1 PREDICTED: coiled-coil domain-containing protein 150 [Latimeria chalumnae]